MKLKFIEAAHQEIGKEKSKADHPNSRTAKACLKLNEESQSNGGSEVVISDLIGGITVKEKREWMQQLFESRNQRRYIPLPLLGHDSWLCKLAQCMGQWDDQLVCKVVRTWQITHSAAIGTSETRHSASTITLIPVILDRRECNWL